jgi:protein farnesyltransferase subunit beta
MASTAQPVAEIPVYFQQHPPIVDTLETETSHVQKQTINECLPLIKPAGHPEHDFHSTNLFGLPPLEKNKHVEFLHDNLGEFPAPFVGLDASRPWMIYWGLLGLYLLGEDITVFRSR